MSLLKWVKCSFGLGENVKQKFIAIEIYTLGACVSVCARSKCDLMLVRVCISVP